MNSTPATIHGTYRVGPLVVLALSLLIPSWLHAAPRQIRLKAHVTVQGELVRLADLFENFAASGRRSMANRAVFRSPDPGTTGKVSVRRVLAAAHQYGLHPDTAPTFSMVSITRSSRTIEPEEFKALIRIRLEERAPHINEHAKRVIRLARDFKAVHIASQIRDDLVLHRLDWSPRSGRFRAHFSIGDQPLPVVRGRTIQMVERVIARTSIAKGQIVSRADLALKQVRFSSQTSNQPSELEALIGKIAKRSLPAGRLVRTDDFEAPRLIEKNQLVTILLEAPGLILRTEGKALSDASSGESLKVLNTQSKRIIFATAKAPGLVSVKLPHADR